MIGKRAPNFSLVGDDSLLHHLDEFFGKSLVIFFYPKDFSPGCTSEACAFNDRLERFREASAEVIGISGDSLASHARFKGKHSLDMLLLSDPELAVHRLYGAYGEKSHYGKTVMGMMRSTILIDEIGNIIRTWHRVRVKNHAQAVLEAVLKSKRG